MAIVLRFAPEVSRRLRVASAWLLLQPDQGVFMEICWETSETKTTDTPGETVAVLRKIASERTQEDAISVELGREDGGLMSAIVYRERACLIWFPIDYDRACVGSFHTVADGFDPEVDEISENPDLITSSCFGHHSEIPIEFTVPLDQAFEAVAEFCHSPDRPSVVSWEMD